MRGQAREVGLVNENVQWYVNGGCAADGIFTVNQTYHDSQLAYDLRGTLGVRACTPAKGVSGGTKRFPQRFLESRRSKKMPGDALLYVLLRFNWPSGYAPEASSSTRAVVTPRRIGRVFSHVSYKCWITARASRHATRFVLQPGPGFKEIRNLTARWASLNPDVYPGAGTNGLTPDGRLDPTLAFAYDAVFALAGGIGSVQATASRWGDSLEGFVTERCASAARGKGFEKLVFCLLHPG